MHVLPLELRSSRRCWVWTGSKCLFLFRMNCYFAAAVDSSSDGDNCSHVQFIFSFIFQSNIHPPLPGKQSTSAIIGSARCCTSGLRLAT